MLGARVAHQRLTRSRDHRRLAGPAAASNGATSDSARRARTRTGSASRPRSSSIQPMPRSPVSNTSRSLSPTRSTMAWKSSSRGHALLDAVDHRELGVALLGLLAQALGLLEQAGVLERRRHARRDAADQVDFGIAERGGARVFHRDRPEQPLAAADRSDHDRTRRGRLRRCRRCARPQARPSSAPAVDRSPAPRHVPARHRPGDAPARERTCRARDRRR